MQVPPPAPIKSFVKYANRKLYDSSTASYVTSNDLLEMVRHDQPFEVYSSHTKEPCTAQMLCQVLWRMSKADIAIDSGKVIEIIRAALNQEQWQNKQVLRGKPL